MPVLSYLGYLFLVPSFGDQEHEKGLADSMSATAGFMWKNLARAGPTFVERVVVVSERVRRWLERTCGNFGTTLP